MRPLRGVVVDVEGSTLVIKAESGLTIRWPQKQNIGLGSRVEIAYDFTHNRVRNVHRRVENRDLLEPDSIEPELPEIPPEMPDDPQEPTEPVGALKPVYGWVGDGWCSPPEVWRG